MVVPLHDQEGCAGHHGKLAAAGWLDAKFGAGIYLTSLPPWADNDAIINNNYRRGSCHRRDRAESFVAISIDSFPAHRALEHVNGSRDIWLLRGGNELSLFRAQASLFLDKDGIEPDASGKSKTPSAIGG